jgi:hypothetical protein
MNVINVAETTIDHFLTLDQLAGCSIWSIDRASEEDSSEAAVVFSDDMADASDCVLQDGQHASRGK